MNCYCCSEKNFDICCAPFLNGSAKPPTAETLMRSRFAAYAIADVEYLIRSTHPKTRKFYNFDDLKKWAESNVWEKLEIIRTNGGGATDKTGTVEFKAFFRDREGNPQIHHEHSNFARELGKWFFVDGEVFES